MEYPNHSKYMLIIVVLCLYEDANYQYMHSFCVTYTLQISEKGQKCYPGVQAIEQMCASPSACTTKTTYAISIVVYSFEFYRIPDVAYTL